jgi:RHS repeat-associated protein
VTEGASTLARFQYDAEGRLLKKIGAPTYGGDTGVRQYVYDQTSRLLEYDGSGATVARFSYGSDRLISMWHLTEGTRFYHLDGLRSVTALTDTAGAVTANLRLDAWGNFRFPTDLSSTANRFAFTGHVFDTETGLYYAKARYFDPKLGRFLTQDSFLGEIDEPPSLHRYLYANDNPTTFVDEDGHSATAVGAVLGFAWGVGQAIGGLADDLWHHDRRPVGEYFARAGSTIAQNTIGGAELGLAVDATVLSGGMAGVVGGAAGNAGLSALTFGGAPERWSDFAVGQAKDAAIGGALGGVLAKAAPVAGKAAGWLGEQVPALARGGKALAAGGRWLAERAPKYKADWLGERLAGVANPLERFAAKPATAATNTAVNIVEGEGGASGATQASVRPAIEGAPAVRTPTQGVGAATKGEFHGPWREVPRESFNWKAHLEESTGTKAPTGIPDPHAHHVLPKRGRPVQRALVQEGQEILRRRGGIDPIFGTQNLTWAPNRVPGQHSTAAIRSVVEKLRALEAAGAPPEEYARVLEELGKVAAARR